LSITVLRPTGSQARSPKAPSRALAGGGLAAWLRGLLPWPWEDWPAEARLLIGLVGLWSVLGLLVLASASWWVAEREMGDGAYYLKRQLIWMVASWGLLLLAVRTHLRRWLHLAPMALLIGCVLVAATLVVGSTVNGASR
jgi:cell division protein FtsW